LNTPTEVSVKAICSHARGGPETLVYEDVPSPRPPAAGEMLVRVHAAAVTPTELTWSPTWTTPDGRPRPFPVIPGHEFSGIVTAVAPGTSGFAPGDAIYGMNDWYGDGAQAEYCLARATDVVPKPRSIDHALAATVPISALTAWQGLIDRAKVQPGERVLVHGAAGGVGLFAVQLARRAGAQVIATASAHNLDFVRGLGASELIDRNAQRFEDVAGKVDVVFDTVGGETLERSWPLLKPAHGRMVTVAASEEQTRDARVRDAFFIVETLREQMAQVASLIDAGELRAVLGARFPLSAAREAYEHKPQRGKVVVSVDGV
jgi:NADPH:quinone reductase-like Zn-dependent oxidoreductase